MDCPCCSGRVLSPTEFHAPFSGCSSSIICKDENTFRLAEYPPCFRVARIYFPLTVYLTLFLAAAWVSVARGAELPKQITGLDGAPLLLVPAGDFVMGSAPGGYIFGDNETPRRRIFLKAFYIDKYEVTNRRFRKFFAPVNRYAGSFEEPDQPVVGVTWFQARDYCARVSRRLPTEAEWEKAARGEDGRIYPWGNERATCARAVMGSEIPSCSKGFATWSVGSRPLGASPYGAMDMAGNATEWVADWYRGNFYAQMPREKPERTGCGEPESPARRRVVQQPLFDALCLSHRLCAP